MKAGLFCLAPRVRLMIAESWLTPDSPSPRQLRHFASYTRLHTATQNLLTQSIVLFASFAWSSTASANTLGGLRSAEIMAVFIKQGRDDLREETQ